MLSDLTIMARKGKRMTPLVILLGLLAFTPAAWADDPPLLLFARAQGMDVKLVAGMMQEALGREYFSSVAQYTAAQ